MSYESQSGGISASIQQDWENRDFIEQIQFNIINIVNFFNKFDNIVRLKLATINEKLTTLERQMDYVEASLRSVDFTGYPNSQKWQHDVADRLKAKQDVIDRQLATQLQEVKINIQRVSPGDNRRFPTPSSTIIVNYTGYLQDGTIFESSEGCNPFQFQLGQNKVVAGLEEAILQMSIGENCRVNVPAQLGYGSNGNPGRVPPNADLVYDIQLLDYT